MPPRTAGYATAKMGMYLQPIVQGSSYHVEFNLFYDPSDEAETAVVRGLATSTIQPLHERRGLLLPAVRRGGQADHEPGCGQRRSPEEVQGDRRPGRHPQSRQTVLLREGTRKMPLKDHRADMESCCRCSACKFIPLEKITGHEHSNACPSISRFNFHSYSGGGRMGFGLGLIRGRVEYTPKTAEVVYNCNLCGACDVSCKYGMEFDVLEPLYAMREGVRRERPDQSGLGQARQGHEEAGSRHRGVARQTGRMVQGAQGQGLRDGEGGASYTTPAAWRVPTRRAGRSRRRLPRSF